MKPTKIASQLFLNWNMLRKESTLCQQHQRCPAITASQDHPKLCLDPGREAKGNIIGMDDINARSFEKYHIY